MTSMRRCQSFCCWDCPDATPGGQNEGSKRIDVNLYEVDALLCGVVR